MAEHSLIAEYLQSGGVVGLAVLMAVALKVLYGQLLQVYNRFIDLSQQQIETNTKLTGVLDDVKGNLKDNNDTLRKICDSIKP